MNFLACPEPFAWNGQDCSTECLPQWMGENCNECAPAWVGENCDQCATGYYGETCRGRYIFWTFLYLSEPREKNVLDVT